MLKTILEQEALLFDAAEISCFAKYSELDCTSFLNPSFTQTEETTQDGARYLLIRLCLRKTERWNKLADLKYQRELNGKHGVLNALRQLCRSPLDDLKVPIEEDVKPKVEKPDVIDLTLEEDVGQETETAVEDDNIPHISDYSFFAKDERLARTDELLGCLCIQDLKALAKDMFLKPKDNKVCSPFITSISVSDSALARHPYTRPPQLLFTTADPSVRVSDQGDKEGERRT